MDRLEEKIKTAPARPGVYLMKDASERIIYVGKAKNLRARARSYFGGTDLRRMIPFLVSRIRDVEFIVTETEKEALILENNLIKKHRPRYNINLRDDKNFYSIRIDTKEKFARFQLVRRVQKDGARYFGPYSSSASMKETFRYLHRIFPLRTCRDLEFKTRKRPCMEFQINRCLAPCCGLVTDRDYRKIVAEAILFMEGRGGSLVRQLRSRMDRAAEGLDFEEAARIRDRIGAVEATLEKQRIVSASFKDQDIFGLYREGDRIQVYAIYVRKGAIIGQRGFPILKTGMESSGALSSLLKQYYSAGVTVPGEIIVPEPVEDARAMEQWLGEKKKGRVSLIVPRRGGKKALLAMALSNAENALQAAEELEANNEESLETLAKCLSLVSFNRGVPEKSGYRRFRIKTEEGADDYGMMREVLERRYREGINMPDLIVVDGGKGQLGVALSVLQGLGLEGVDVVGLAKKSRTRPAGVGSTVFRDRDRVYLPGRKNPLYLDRHPRALLLLQRVRDEAHRFAITYHRKVRKMGSGKMGSGLAFCLFLI
ncbi:MAG: excinuclease ABC subunit UvrC [Deltaproteobacteria bacterium]|nr:excinuclease ABC subunit UvrC [Deltaproteobacteria bacterium]